MGFEARNNLNGYENRYVIENGYSNGNGLIYGYEEKEIEIDGEDSPTMNGLFDSKAFSPSSTSSSVSVSSPKRCIEHRVTKLDTLAGIAIRYGVEVADIKKMNSLVTDLQMFGLKTLRIPLPGRHPPSPCLSESLTSAGSNQTPSRHMHSDLLESFQSLKLTPDRNLSPAMSSLRDYYGLNGRRSSSEGYDEDEGFSTTSSLINPPLSQHRRSRSVANGLKTEEDESEDDVDTYYQKWINKLKLRAHKTVDTTRSPEKLLKEENGSGGWFSAITGKGLALRTKAPSRTNLASEVEPIGENGFPSNLGEYVVCESSSGVRKSFSTPSLEDRGGNGSVSVWSVSNWSLTPDLQAAFANTIFEGLPKPITGRRAKAALD